MAAAAQLSGSRLSGHAHSFISTGYAGDKIKGTQLHTVGFYQSAICSKLSIGRRIPKPRKKKWRCDEPWNNGVKWQGGRTGCVVPQARATAGGGGDANQQNEVHDFEDLVEKEAAAFSSSGTDRNLQSDDESDPMQPNEDKIVTMAEAFNVSSVTVNTIICSIAGIAIAVPAIGLRNPAIGQFLGLAGGTLRAKVLAYVTMLLGFYMAWNIGANDVANAMGTSVGSGALTLRQAIFVAAILEFSGAFLVGSHVTHTMQKGIVDSAAFQNNPALLFCGMLASLGSSGTWLQVASWYGWPVSTTHSIIGALVGFGLVYGGVGAVYWGSLGRVVASWLVSPLLGAVVSFIVYKCIRTFVYRAPSPGLAACRVAPIAVFTGVSGLSFMSFLDGSNLTTAALKALGSGLLGAVVMHFAINQQLGPVLKSLKAREKSSKANRPAEQKSRTGGPKGLQLKMVYKVFGYLQVLSACFMSFAHGANDVANAIGPISAALSILYTATANAAAGTVTVLSTDVGISTGVLAWGGFGIVAGLLVWGYRVIATIGKKITELTPTRGFAAEFAAATVVVLASRLGLPVSATHTLVGAVMGVGFARGLNSIQGDTVKSIVASWAITIPLGASLAVLYTAILRIFIKVLV